jgi:hypothetical protein
MAMARATCVYCGAPLPVEAGEAAGRASVAAASPPPSAETAARTLVILDLAAATEEAVASALGLSVFEAGQRRKRGGLQLHRIVEEGRAREEAAALRAAGLEVLLVPEGEARTPSLHALGGSAEAGSLRLRTREGDVPLRAEDLRLVVRGPIVRAYQPSLQIRRLRSASLDGGYRIHLHRRADPRPVELDPGNFEFGFAVTGSSLLELLGWIAAVAPAVPVDDEFRRLPPELSLAAPPTFGVMAAAAGLSRPDRGQPDYRPRQIMGGFGADEAPAVLDNLPQFRFYSGWRAAVERRRN